MPIETLLPSSVGAPIPLVLAEESCVILAYYVPELSPGWDGKSVRLVGSNRGEEEVALIRFSLC
ncbi:MAG: hypothetical protein WB762_35505 [Candidatus Sulfotelmatobacter sp.]